MRRLLLGLFLVSSLSPANARLWNPTPFQQAADYLTITHNKGAQGRVVVAWMASPTVASPVVKPILDKYVVISIIHTHPQPLGPVTFDDVEGVQVTDGAGVALKELSGDAIPPMLVGIIASANASLRQSTQGNGKMHWGVYEAGSVNACQKSKLLVSYDGETYSFDGPIPGCPQ